MFDLNQQMGEWRTQLQTSPALQPADLDELESHLRDTIEMLHDEGLDFEEAFWVACHRIGNVQSLQGEFSKVDRGIIGAHRLFWILFSIAALISLLVYSEVTIRNFKELESDRAQLYAHLYALAISSEITDEKATVIFRDIILSPKVNFPIIFTDSQGDIHSWKGCGLADSGGPSSEEMMRELEDLLKEMDQSNQPIPISVSGEPLYFLHYGTPGLVGNMYLSSYIKGVILLLLLLLLGYICFRWFSISWYTTKKAVRSGT